VTKRFLAKHLTRTLPVVLALSLAPSALAQTCTGPNGYADLQAGLCTLANPVAPLLPATQPKFVYELPQPIFYQPDPANPVFDYYEIFSAEATLGIASTTVPFAGGITPAVQSAPVPGSPGQFFDTWGTITTPVNKVWLGLKDPVTAANLNTEVWGYGQWNAPAGYALGQNVTYPAMSFRATKGKPVKVMWMNKLPNVHVFCKKPLDQNYPCGIDRSLMGTLGTAPHQVNAFGGTQQPDNAMVVHLHGGEIPPDSDGFAELWFGNATTAAAYSFPTTTINGAVQDLDPHFTPPVGNAILNPVGPGPACDLFAAIPIPCPNATDQCVGNQPPTATTPSVPGVCWNGLYNGNGTTAGDPNVAPWLLGSLVRPTGDSMIYNYPMVQDAATLWYHDHALGKTRVNVAAGPAGYFYVQDPAVDVPLWGALPDQPGYRFGDCSNAGILGGLCRDVPVVLQDRAFNADGSVNFPNLLGQIAPVGANPLTPGPNPTIHPQWVPEYFGDHAVVNGVIWPKLTVSPDAYRIRFLDGSNARCYTLSMTVKAPPRTTNFARTPPRFNLIASDQGYLPLPSVAQVFSICPGERYEAVIDFSGMPAGAVVSLVNTGGAPFPNGITPQAPGSPDAFLATMMQFHVRGAAVSTPWTVPAAWATAVTAPVNARIAALTATPAPAVNPNYFVLNEVLDPVTAAPLRVQIDGKRFEDPVSEAPPRGAIQYWDIVNTTVDTHPMHLHLVQFKVIGRWSLNMARLNNALTAAGFLVPGATFNKALVNPMNFIAKALPPVPGEEGFKDTAKSNPGELLRVVAKWDAGWADCPAGTALNGSPNLYNAALPVCGTPAVGTAPFYQPVTAGPYVWHCHIVDHEDNEMMRPTLVMP